jgi:acetyl-CoA acetyltransferase
MDPHRAVICGIGSTDHAALAAPASQPRDAVALAAQALSAALADSGLALDDLDGLVASRIHYESASDDFGLRRLRFLVGYEGAGRMTGIALQHAVLAIESGAAEVVALVYGNNGRSAGMSYGGDYIGNATAAYDSLHGMTSPGAYVAAMYRRYLHGSGDAGDALAPFALSNRLYAALNPRAVMRTVLTREQYRDSRYIAEPLRLHDYCLINDGAIAVILCARRHARRLRQVPVAVRAIASRSDIADRYISRDFYHDACAAVATELYAKAGIERADIDVLQVYDNFTPITLFTLEGFGFASRGAGCREASVERFAPDGDLPLNTSGGHTSEGYMQGWGHLHEAVVQLRGAGGARQVPGARLAQYACASPIVSSCILAREE